MSIKQDIADFWVCKDWYTNARKELYDLYGGDAVLMALCLAATSPRQTVKTNWTKAKAALKRIKKDRANAYFGDYLLAHRKNLEKIRDAHRHSSNLPLLTADILSGRKVQSFAYNLLGDYGRVTVDMWMLSYFNRESATAKVYDYIEKRIQTIAPQYGLFPAELQAILWSAERARFGYKPATFLIASIEDHQTLFDFMED